MPQRLQLGMKIDGTSLGSTAARSGTSHGISVDHPTPRSSAISRRSGAGQSQPHRFTPNLRRRSVPVSIRHSWFLSWRSPHLPGMSRMRCSRSRLEGTRFARLPAFKGVSSHTLYKWLRLFAEPSPKWSGIDHEAENRRMKREPARVTEERDIIKQGEHVSDNGLPGWHTNGRDCRVGWIQALSQPLWRKPAVLVNNTLDRQFEVDAPTGSG